MQVRVLYFSLLRDRAGERQEDVPLPENAKVQDLKATLGEIHPNLVEALQTAMFAINKEFAFPDEALQDGDEVAVFPPVSGGSEPPALDFYQLTDDALDLNALLQRLVTPTSGAACVFTGVVRGVTEREGGRETSRLEYESFAEMAEIKLQQIAEEIRERWPAIESIGIVQRTGILEPGTPAVMIACTSAHRDEGIFEAARYGIDRLKQIVPVWKKEIGPDGETWVEGDYRPTQRDKKA
jgi:molybdopterin converting factor subunit 1